MEELAARLPLQDEIDTFMSYLAAERRVSPHTCQAYRSDLAQLQAFLQDNDYRAGVAQLDKRWLRRWLATIAGSLKPETIARKVSCLRSFFKFLMRTGRCENDPAARLETPKLGRRLPKFLNAEDAAAVMENPQRTPLDPAYRARDAALLEVL